MMWGDEGVAGPSSDLLCVMEDSIARPLLGVMGLGCPTAAWAPYQTRRKTPALQACLLYTFNKLLE